MGEIIVANSLQSQHGRNNCAPCGRPGTLNLVEMDVSKIRVSSTPRVRRHNRMTAKTHLCGGFRSSKPWIPSSSYPLDIAAKRVHKYGVDETWIYITRERDFHPLFYVPPKECLLPILENQSGFESDVSELTEDSKELRRSDWKKKTKDAKRNRRKRFKKSKTPTEKKVLQKTNKKKKKKPLDNHAGPQSGFDRIRTIFDSFQTSNDMEPIRDLVENIYLTFFNLSNCQDTVSFVHTLLAHLKLFTKKSITGLVYDWLVDEFDFKRNQTASQLLADFVDTDASVVSPLDIQAGEKPAWLTQLKNFKWNWTVMTKSSFGKSACKVISLCAALGLCELENFDVSLGDIKLFSIKAQEKQVCATDFITAILETTVYFVEGGYRVFHTGDIQSFFLDDADALELEARYFEIVELHPLFKAGNLERVKGIDENDYAQKLDKTITDYSQLYSRTSETWMKKSLSDKLHLLKKYRVEFSTYSVNGSFRIAPYMFFCEGASGVGKSTIYHVMLRTLLQANGFKASDDRIAVMKDTDQFDSTITSATNGVIMDDMGNTQSAWTKMSPTDRMIEIKNNAPAYANKAEAELKGKVSFQVKGGAVTSNCSAYDIGRTYSNEPFSFVRRLDSHYKIRVKEEFSLPDGRLDSYKVTDKFGAEPIPDCFDIDIGIPNANTDRKVEWVYKNVSFEKALEFLVQHSRRHFQCQNALVERSRDMDEKLNVCHMCGLPDRMCKGKGVCIATNVGKGVSSQDVNEIKEKIRQSLIHEQGEVELSSKKKILEEQVGEIEAPVAHANALVTDIMQLHSQTFGLLRFVPDWIYDAPTCVSVLIWMNRSAFRRALRDDVRKLSLFMFCLFWVFLSLNLLSVWCLGVVFCTWLWMHKYWYLRNQLIEQIQFQRGVMPSIVSHVRAKDVAFIAGGCVALGVFYSFAKEYLRMRRLIRPREESISSDIPELVSVPDDREEPAPLVTYRDMDDYKTVQGNLCPENMDEIRAREQEKNPWAGVVIDKMPRHEKHGITLDSLKTYVARGLYGMVMMPNSDMPEDWNPCSCDAVFLKSNLALIPNHVWKMRDVEVDHFEKVWFVRRHPESLGGCFSVSMSKKHSYHIPNTDLCLVYIASGGDHKNLTNYLHDPRIAGNSLSDMPATMMWKNPNTAEVREARAYLRKGTVNSMSGEYDGFNYSLPLNTHLGMCMGTWISETKIPAIVAFHLCGKTDTPIGAAGTLTLEQFEVAEAALKKIPGVLPCADEGEMLDVQYDKKYVDVSRVHPKHPVNFLPRGSNIRVFGDCIGRSSYKSEVVPTVISEAVFDITGVPQKWGPPMLRPKGPNGETLLWKPWRDSLIHSANTSSGVPGHLLTRAVEDYLGPLKERILRDAELASEIRPLTRMETVNGIEGKRFIDRIPISTSAGFPLMSKKEKHMMYLDPLIWPDWAVPMDAQDYIWKQYDLNELAYKRGERCYFVFGTNLKDEATKKGKEKVRAYQAAPFVLQLFTRRYFLPLARYVSLTPLESECAVGVNAVSPEWDQLSSFVSKFGKDRILAGDYSKYDLRMPAQLIMAAFDVLIELAKATGNYTEEDITIMTGVATDIAFAVTAYNGVLLQHFGSAPSGHNLTVYVNSIVNSLLMRCAYFESQGLNAPDFRSVVALITYGDDAKGSVHKAVSGFDHIVVADFLAKHDMKFTMPDKESIPTPFMHDDDADLLKRANVVQKETGVVLGALHEDSIFKSLHAVLKSKAITPEQQAMQNIDGALREWFVHGEEVYEKRRSQMNEVAKRCELTHGCQRLDVSYAECVEEFRSKYLE